MPSRQPPLSDGDQWRVLRGSGGERDVCMVGGAGSDGEHESLVALEACVCGEIGLGVAASALAQFPRRGSGRAGARGARRDAPRVLRCDAVAGLGGCDLARGLAVGRARRRPGARPGSMRPASTTTVWPRPLRYSASPHQIGDVRTRSFDRAAETAESQ